MTVKAAHHTTKPKEAEDDDKDDDTEPEQPKAKEAKAPPTLVTYLGPAASREFSAKDLTGLDADYDGGAVSFNRENGFQVGAAELSEAIVEYLVSEGEFAVGDLTKRQSAHVDDKVVLADNTRPVRVSVAPEYMGG